MKREIDYESINDLYMSWFNERDPFMQRKIKDDIIKRISPYELLIYSARFLSPFKAFRNIFSLNDLFETLKEMQRQGEDIKRFTNQSLLIENPEEVITVSNFARRERTSEINNFGLIFKGSNVFEFGDIKNIGEKFPYAYVNNLSLNQIEQMLKSKQDYKGIPITITIDNIGELPLDKLNDIERAFDIDGIEIVAKDRSLNLAADQGECTPLNLSTYKKIRTVVDDEIISKLYVYENLDKKSIDLQLATQIIDKIANRIEYDFEATKKSCFSNELKKASGLVGLLTGKSICKGYSEILRNVLSCVNIDSTVIDGVASNENEPHAWNQVKIGDLWFNIDLTFARNDIREGKPSGDLFMSDINFYGERRKVTFDQGKEKKGKSIESTVMTGGHLRTYGSNSKQCKANLNPLLISKAIQKSRLYAEEYLRESKSTNYSGLIPYNESNAEKIRNNSKSIETPTH